ncbi:hypothetical protein V9T40_011504 [Parthenolecanium corni]|uniref:BHLH domain-containing protein n=1 Tax=Parthenolecanium corni TaxID=536013 RepID=A0AAN9T5K8_9HEMI
MRPDGRCYVLPNSNVSSGSEYDEQPVSRTYQYRKVMKPMLERKRRARINRCLDELKELMLTALQSEGENVSKLEKADILEMTVRHLHKLKSQRLGLGPDSMSTDRFLAGFIHCTHEVSQYLHTILQSQNAADLSKMAEPTVEQSSGVKLLQHLACCIRRIEHASYRREDPYLNPYSTPPPSPSPNLSSIADSRSSASPSPTPVWRPW